MFKIIVDEKIELRLLKANDAQELYTLIDLNRDFLRQWLPWLDSVTDKDDSVIFIEKSNEDYESKNGIQAGIWYEDKLVGVIGFHKFDWVNKATSIGYWMGSNYQKRGIMTKACKAMVNYAFKELELHRLEIRCAMGNDSSRDIPKRLGMVNVGTVRDAEWLYDKYVHNVIYEMLEDDWGIV